MKFVLLLTLIFSATLGFSESQSESAEREQRARAAAESADKERAREIREAAARLRQDASKVRSAADEVQRDTRDLESTTSSIQRETSEMNSRRQRIAGEISDLQQEASSLRMEEGRLKNEAQQARRQRAAVETDNKSLKTNLTALLKVVYNLQARADFKTKSLDNLKTFAAQLKSTTDNYERVLQLQADSLTAFSRTAQAHAEWMIALGIVTEKYAPHFADIKDMDGIKQASYLMKGILTAYPSQTAVLNSEDQLVALQKQISTLSQRIQEQLRELSAHPGLPVFNLYSNNSLPAMVFKEKEESVYKNVELALQAETLVTLLRDRRSFLTRVIPVMWDRMLNVRLDSINLEGVVNAGNVAAEGLNLVEITNRIPIDIDGNRQKAIVLFRQHYSPLSALDLVGKALTTSQTFLAQIARMQETGSTSTVKNEIEKRQPGLERLRKKIEDAIRTKGNSYWAWRTAKAQNLRSNSAACISNQRTVLMTENSRENEAAFQKLMEGCL